MNIIFFVLGIFVVSCAHHDHGPNSIVAMHSKKEVDIWLEDSNVRTGDKVHFYREDCQIIAKIKRCNKKVVGNGKIIQVIGNSRYSVDVADGSALDEHVQVEKIP